MGLNSLYDMIEPMDDLCVLNKEQEVRNRCSNSSLIYYQMHLIYVKLGTTITLHIT
jgi:hypothetical protein